MHPQRVIKHFFQQLFDKITSLSEGILICGGDWNTILNHNKDTTSFKRCKNQKSKALNWLIKDAGLCDVWRDRHPLERDYTHFSAAHKVHSRIDFFLINTYDRHRVIDCNIGIADVSDHNTIDLTIHLHNQDKKTLWKMNIGILNNEAIVQELKEEIRDCIAINKDDQIEPTIIWDTVKAVMRGKLISRTAHIKKMKRLTQSKLEHQLRNLEKLQHTDTSDTLVEGIKDVRKQLTDLATEETERKLRFTKQTFYESGPKATKILAKRLRSIQIRNAINKIRDPINKEIYYEPGKNKKRLPNILQNLIRPARSTRRKRNGRLSG